jgi:hypothetical protein
VCFLELIFCAGFYSFPRSTSALCCLSSRVHADTLDRSSVDGHVCALRSFFHSLSVPEVAGTPLPVRSGQAVGTVDSRAPTNWQIACRRYGAARCLPKVPLLHASVVLKMPGMFFSPSISLEKLVGCKSRIIKLNQWHEGREHGVAFMPGAGGRKELLRHTRPERGGVCRPTVNIPRPFRSLARRGLGAVFRLGWSLSRRSEREGSVRAS